MQWILFRYLDTESEQMVGHCSLVFPTKSLEGGPDEERRYQPLCRYWSLKDLVWRTCDMP